MASDDLPDSAPAPADPPSSTFVSGSPEGGAPATWSPFIEDAKNERRKALLIALPVGLIVVLLAVIVFFRPKGGDDGPDDVQAIDGITSTTFRPPSSFAVTTTTIIGATTTSLLTVTTATIAPIVTTSSTTATSSVVVNTTTTTRAATTTTLPATVGITGKVTLAGQVPTEQACRADGNPNQEFRTNGYVDIVNANGAVIGSGRLIDCEKVEPVGSTTANERWSFTATATRQRGGQYRVKICPSDPTSPILESGKNAYSNDNLRTDRKTGTAPGTCPARS